MQGSLLQASCCDRRILSVMAGSRQLIRRGTGRTFSNAPMNRYSPICDQFSHVMSVDDVVSVVVAFECNLMQHMLAIIHSKN